MADEATELAFLEFDATNHASATDFLASGEMKVLGRLQGSSNATLAVEVSFDDEFGLAVYKPAAGERPLDDFPQGSLPMRERVTYLLSEALGWHLVPPTILREDAPFGLGSLQLFIPHDPNENAFTLYKEVPEAFRRLVVLDILANNADRKAGHVIRDQRNQRLWAIDNGLTFHTEPKLRTVLWPYAGRPIGEEILEELKGLDGFSLGGLLDPIEAASFKTRLDELLANPVYPSEPDDRYPYPWPPI